MDEMTLTLNSPITEEQWDMIEDVDFDHTDSITFYTKHGKEVEFVKRKTGKWIIEPYDVENDIWVHRCGECMKVTMLGSNKSRFNYCPNCGARLVQEGEKP